MALTTASAIRTNYLNIADTSQDSILTALIAQATSIIESITMQPIDAVSTDIYFQGNGSRYHSLTYTVPVSLSTLSYKLEPDDASWTSVSGAVVYESDNLTRLYYGNGFTYPFWKATCTVGYSMIPNDIVNICSEITVDLFNSTDFGGGDNRFGLASLASSEGGITATTVYKDMYSRWRTKLLPYIRRTW